MNMKLSYRDKVILIVVICAVIIGLGIVLFVKPRVLELEDAKSSNAAKQAEMQSVQDKIGTLDSLITQLKDTATEIDTVQQNFYIESDPYQFEQMIMDKLKARNLKYTSFETSYVSAGTISQYIVNPKNFVYYDTKLNADIYNELPKEIYDAVNQIKRETNADINIGVTYVNLGFEGRVGMDDMLSVLDILAADEKALIVNTCAGKANTDATVTTSDNSITLTIYSIVPMNIEKVNEENATLAVS